MHTKKMISIVIPVYNEQAVLYLLIDNLINIFDKLEPKYNMKAIFIDDGSHDDSWKIMKEISAKDARFNGIRLSRNFGHQAALSCGYELAPGDALISIDADMQDPPDLIPEMIQLWEQGSAVVLPVRRKREGESNFKLWTATLYYKLIAKIAETKAPKESGDFRLLDRVVVDALNTITERHRYIRGLVGWLGFKTATLEYDRRPRRAGTTKYTIIKMMRLALDGIISFSFMPLRAAYISAILLMLPFLIYLIYSLILNFIYGVPMVPGWTSLILAIVLFGTFNLLMLGIIGEYIGRMYNEVKGRPIYLVEEVHGTLNDPKIGK